MTPQRPRPYGEIGALIPVPAQPGPYTPLTNTEKLKLHTWRMVRPSGFARSVVSAGLDQWTDDPPEWGQGMAGYGRRYAHKIATRAVRNTLALGIDTALGQDPRYFASEKPGTMTRMGHAVKYTFLTRTDDGGTAVAWWRIGASFGGQAISNTWRPPSDVSARQTFTRGAMSLGFDAAQNIFREFWPDIRKKLFRR